MNIHREKTCPRGFPQSEIQTSLLSYRDYLENSNFITYMYDTFQIRKALISLPHCCSQIPEDRFSHRGPYGLCLHHFVDFVYDSSKGMDETGRCPAWLFADVMSAIISCNDKPITNTLIQIERGIDYWHLLILASKFKTQFWIFCL